MKVILAGGGTAGSVMPLVAIASELKQQKSDTEFLFIGTRKGEPEKEILENYDIPFVPILSGKFRRYFDLRNILDVFLVIIGFFQSLQIISKFKPDLILGAGGFVQLPVCWAGWLLGRKIIIHQQDFRPSLANTLVKRLADKITVNFEKSISDFPLNKTVWTGNPVRTDIWSGDRERAYETFNLKKDKPVVLITGGGTGALTLNKIIYESLLKLLEFCQVIHLTGQGKGVNMESYFTKTDDEMKSFIAENYHQYEFIRDEMKDALAVADLIVSRAGLSALTEFSVLGKAVILVPLPHTHQEENADYFGQKEAAVVIYQENLTPSILVNKIKELLDNRELLNNLSINIKQIIKPDATNRLVEQILHLFV